MTTYRRSEFNHIAGMCFYILINSKGRVTFHGWSLETKWDHIIHSEQELRFPTDQKSYYVRRTCNQFGKPGAGRMAVDAKKNLSLKAAWKYFYSIVRQHRSDVQLPIAA